MEILKALSELRSWIQRQRQRSLPDRLFWIRCAKASIATALLRALVMTVESPPQVGAKRSCFCSLALKGFSIHNKKVINVKLPLPGTIDLKIITTIKGVCVAYTTC